MTAVTDEGPGRIGGPASHEDRDPDGQGRTSEAGRISGAGRIPEAGREWNDGLIARRATTRAADPGPETAPDDDVRPPQVEAYVPSGGPLRPRLDALRELVGLSRARLDGDTLAEAGRVLDEAAARQRLSSRHTVVAIAGATGSGKSTLFNTLAGAQISDTGLRRPTTAAPSPAPGPTGPPDCSTGSPSRAGSGAGRSRAARTPTRPSRASSSSTCPTTTRRRPNTGNRSTGCSHWSTP